MMPPLPRLRALACVAVLIALFLPGMVAAQSGTLTFLHVNDVDEIEPVKGRGGIAPLMTLLRQERQRNPQAITTLGGDFLSPSLLSGITKGAQMVAMFNAISVDATVFGNHEFDFGPEPLKARIAESKFPWIGTNVIGPDGKPFGGAVDVWTRTVGDIKVGFLGLVTPDTVRLSSPGPDIRFPAVLETAAGAVARLRAEGAHVIVALTHLEIAQDRQLADKVEGIDLILGGHDHDPISLYEGGTLILKAGANAHFLGVVDLRVATTDTPKGAVTTVLPAEWRLVTTAEVAPDAETAALVKGYSDELDANLAVAIGTTQTDLDSRRGAVRSRETTMGNLIADAMRETLKADVAITNGGGIRADRLHPAGTHLTRKDIFAELPFGNTGVLVEMTGADLLKAVEHGVGKVESGAGRFPQVAGMTIAYDPKAPAGTRVTDVRVSGKPLDPAAIYRVATNDFMAKGGDGYTMFLKAKPLIDPAGAVLLATIVMNYVEAKGTVAPKIEGRIVAK